MSQADENPQGPNPQGPTPGLVAQDLVKVFPGAKGQEVRAVDGVSFKAFFGEVYGLLGVNGAGKTTVLRMLSTMLTPTSGEAKVCGFDVQRNPKEVRARIGFMSTATSLYGRLTAREMVTYFGRLNGMKEEAIDKRVDELFGLFDMKEFGGRRCDKLSTGMKQKVSIVRTVLHDPDVLVFDEPTAGLDVLTSRTIVDFVRDCRERGKCVIFSTHIMDEVEKLCDRVGVIHEGKLWADEPLESLQDRAPSRRVEEAFVSLVEGSFEEVPEKETVAEASEGGETAEASEGGETAGASEGGETAEASEGGEKVPAGEAERGEP